MARIYKRGLCFVHVPKTGGKWVRTVLPKAGYGEGRDVSTAHHPAPDDLPDDVTSFCFIRHPASWLASWWAYCERAGWPNEMPESHDESRPFDRMQRITMEYRNDSFEHFVRNLEGDHPGFVAAFFAPFIASVDIVGRQETLREDLEEIVGPVPDVEPVNVGINRPNPSPEIVRFVSDREPLEELGYAAA